MSHPLLLKTKPLKAEAVASLLDPPLIEYDGKVSFKCSFLALRCLQAI